MERMPRSSRLQWLANGFDSDYMLSRLVVSLIIYVLNISVVCVCYVYGYSAFCCTSVLLPYLVFLNEFCCLGCRNILHILFLLNSLVLCQAVAVLMLVFL